MGSRPEGDEFLSTNGNSNNSSQHHGESQDAEALDRDRSTSFLTAISQANVEVHQQQPTAAPTTLPNHTHLHQPVSAPGDDGSLQSSEDEDFDRDSDEFASAHQSPVSDLTSDDEDGDEEAEGEDDDEDGGDTAEDSDEANAGDLGTDDVDEGVEQEPEFSIQDLQSNVYVATLHVCVSELSAREGRKL